MSTASASTTTATGSPTTRRTATARLRPPRRRATPTPLGLTCGTAPAVGCIAPEKGSLIVNEKKAGKEKLKVKLTKLQPAVTQSQFGDPVSGTTAYAICIYDAANQLKGSYTVDARRTTPAAGKPCWSAISDKGYKYGDKSAAADGILKMKLSGGDAGKGKIKVIGKNTTGQLAAGRRGPAAEPDQRDGPGPDQRCLMLRRRTHAGEEGGRHGLQRERTLISAYARRRLSDGRSRDVQVMADPRRFDIARNASASMAARGCCIRITPF